MKIQLRNTLFESVTIYKKPFRKTECFLSVGGENIYYKKRIRGGFYFDVSGGDGSLNEVEIKRRFLDPHPKISVNGRLIEVSPPLGGIEKTLCFAPFACCIIGGGGVIGALIGTAGSRYNFNVFRSKRKTHTKITLSVFSLFVSVMVMILASLCAAGLMAHLFNS